MTSNTNRVVARTQRYDYKGQFGFVRLGNGEEVCIRQEQCREMDGTPEEPIFSDRPDTEASCRMLGDRVVLQLVSGPRGPEVAMWGFLPPPEWQQELLRSKALQRYRHGSVHVNYYRFVEGEEGYDPYEESIHFQGGRVLRPPFIHRGDPCRLSVTFGRSLGFGEWESLDLRLANAFPSSRPQLHGNYCLYVRTYDHPPARWAKVVFCLSG